MLSTYIILAVLSATSISAVPLNINLGAYSPALVVGDGEISFDSTQKASELMETLATGALTQGQQNTEQQGEQAAEEPAPEKARDAPAEANIPAPNVRSPESEVTRRAPEPKVARSPEPKVARSPEPEVARRAVDELDGVDLVAEATEWIKRDIAGFREALNFAREAMKNQPKVELGTGAEGSGVGITVNGGLNVPANSAANGAPAPGAEKRNAKRGVEVEEGESPKMTLVAITEV